MFDEIYHINGEHDLIAEDFSLPFLLRKFVGSSKLHLYAALRVTGNDPVSSFICSFGGTLYGAPEAIAKAATAFETTNTFAAALDEASARLGEEFIRSELRKRCEEAAGFTRDVAMDLSVRLHTFTAPEDSADVVQAAFRHSARDEKLYSEFAAQRREERQKVRERETRFQRDLEAA